MPRSFITALILIGVLLTSAGIAGMFVTRPQHMPRIEIQTTDSLNRVEKVDAHFTFYSLDHTIETNALVKLRGGFSWNHPKQSYTINLDSDLAYDGLEPDDDWMLISCYIDKTLMRHKLCYDLFNLFSDENYAPESRFVEVSVNEDYKGIYLLKERPDEKRMKINQGENHGTLFKDARIFRLRLISSYDSTVSYYDQKYPDWTEDNYEYLLDSLNAYLFAQDTNFRSKEVGIHRWFDMDNIIDWHLLLLLTNNSDGLMKNYYLYQKENGQPFRLAIWDYDHSFGRDGDNEPNMMQRELDINRNYLLRKWMGTNYQDYRQRLSDRWLWLRENILYLEKLNHMIDQNAETVRPLVDKNFERWPVDGPHYYDKATFEEEVQRIKDYLEMRLPYLDEYFRELPTLPPDAY